MVMFHYNFQTHKNRKKEKIGKIDFDAFSKFILQHLGHKDDSVVVPHLTGIVLEDLEEAGVFQRTSKIRRERLR